MYFRRLLNEKIDLQFVDIPSLEGMFLQEPERREESVCAPFDPGAASDIQLPTNLGIVF